jgi:hypothetical protein
MKCLAGDALNDVGQENRSFHRAAIRLRKPWQRYLTSPARS